MSREQQWGFAYKRTNAAVRVDAQVVQARGACEH